MATMRLMVPVVSPTMTQGGGAGRVAVERLLGVFEEDWSEAVLNGCTEKVVSAWSEPEVAAVLFSDGSPWSRFHAKRWQVRPDVLGQEIRANLAEGFELDDLGEFTYRIRYVGTR